MAPRGGGGRVRRGPHDHLEAIIYMSRATPRKAKGRPLGLAHGRQASCQAAPSPPRDHGPDGPDGPEGVEGPFLRPRIPSPASGGGSPVSAAGAGSPVGTISAHGPDTAFGGTPDHRWRAFGGDPRLAKLWFAPAFDSTGCGLAAPKLRPVVCRARRRDGRRPLVTAVVPGRPSQALFRAAPRPARNPLRRGGKRE